MDFTLHKYAALCQALVASGYTPLTISEYILAARDKDLPAKVVVLRHDVDRRPSYALKMAQVEQAHALTATYYFRTVPQSFQPAAIRQIHAMGHEVGYHYETLAQTDGDIPRAVERFGEELRRLREVVPVRSASMHGSPLSQWDNRAIWEVTTPAAFDLVGEAYRDIDYSQMVYLNDTGRTWNPTRYNLRDITTHLPPVLVESTDELIGVIRQGNFPQLCLSAHPERWQDNHLAWTLQAVRDVLLNGVKMVLKQVYQIRH